MLGIYFSGTGNTKHCVTYFTAQSGSGSKCISIENANITQEIALHETLVFGYPIYFSNTPKIVRDFILDNKTSFAGKKVYILATMGLFSGDGTGCAARLLQKCGAVILGGLHLKMPDCIGDERALKKPLEKNQKIIRSAEEKMDVAAVRWKEGKPNQEGLGFFYHMAGLFGQRLWFYKKSMTYQKKPNVSSVKCIGCGKCAELCPMHNIEIVDKKAVSHDRCTLCYRCVSHCPTQALTILGKRVYEQCLFEKYEEPSL